MKNRFSLLIALVFLFIAVPMIGAQTAPGLSGRWEGELKTPGEGIGMVLELVRGGNDRWQGIAVFPGQSDVKLRLLNLKVDGATVSFDMQAAPGYPSFEGKLSADGQSISGEFMQSGHSIATELKRKGEPTIKPVAPAASSSALDPVKGDWEGSLNAGGQTLRLKFKFAPNSGSDIPGILDSVDQQTFLAVDAIVAEKGGFRFDLNLIQGSFTAKLSPDGATLDGIWDQAGASFPLTLKRLPTPAKP